MEREQDLRGDMSADAQEDTPIFNELLEGRRITQPGFLQPFRTRARVRPQLFSRHSQ